MEEKEKISLPPSLPPRPNRVPPKPALPLASGGGGEERLVPPPLVVARQGAGHTGDGNSSAAEEAVRRLEEGQEGDAGAEAFISPTLRLKEKNVMPLEIKSIGDDVPEGAARSPTNATAADHQHLDASAEPYVKGIEAPNRTVRFGVPAAAGEDGGQGPSPSKPAAINPALSRSYHVRQLAFRVAQRYSRLYSEAEAKAIQNQYKLILKRHNNNSAIRRLHKTIVSDVLDPSDTRLPTVMLNGLCPLGLRAVFNACGAGLTSNFWQKNTDDEITFYSLQFLAFSILPIFPTLVSSIVSVLSMSWTITKQSCRAYPHLDASNVTAASFSDAETSSQCPLAWSQVYDKTIPAHNHKTAQGVFTSPAVWSQGGQCVGIASAISMTNGYQIGLVLVYAAFIAWALVRLYVKLKQLRYMKIASHLKAVYVSEAYDREGQPWYKILLLQMQAMLPDLFPLLLTGLFLFLQIKLNRAEGVMQCLILHDPALTSTAAELIKTTSSTSTRRCFAVCSSLAQSFRLEFHQVTNSLIDVVVQTGIFAATAHTLVQLLHKQFFFIDAEKFMDPEWEPPYKSIHEYRARIMTRQMVDDYEILRKEMFVDTVKKQFPRLFDVEDPAVVRTPKYVRGVDHLHSGGPATPS